MSGKRIVDAALTALLKGKYPACRVAATALNLALLPVTLLMASVLLGFVLNSAIPSDGENIAPSWISQPEQAENTPAPNADALGEA